MESSIVIPCNSVRLEGLLNLNPSARGGVVITHPHPLYGGNMYNPVVEQIALGFFDAGFTTLRFNFRGTCSSSGMFDNGVGEQEDVRAALDFLANQGMPSLSLAGYSFGAWVNAHVVSAGVEIHDHVMVSPPAAFLSFDSVKTLPNTGLIVTGENDDIAPPDQVQALIRGWNISSQFEILTGIDHFYASGQGRLRSVLSGYLAQ